MAAVHHRRLRLDEESAKKSEQVSPAQRRTTSAGSASVAAAERAIASRGDRALAGANWRCHSPPTRVSRWLPVLLASMALIAAIAPDGG
jgi:hypothetical protein